MSQLDPSFEENIDYKYLGNDSIEAFSLYKSQIHFLNAIESTQKKKYPGLSLSIKIKVAENGSHIVPIIFTLIPLNDLFSGISLKDGVDYIKSLFELLKNLLEIHKIIKEEKPIKEVINNNGTTNIDFGNNNTFNIGTLNLQFYKENPAIVNEIAQSFKALEKNEQIAGIEISDKKDKAPLISVSRDDFSTLTHSSMYLKEDDSFKDKPNVTVFVKNTNFYPTKGKAWIWEFIYNGLPIKGNIVDKDFEQLINQGTRFGQGDRLMVDLRVLFKMDSKIKTSVIKGYEVLKVHNPIYREDNGGDNRLTF